MTMLLKQLIESPITSSKLLVCDPFKPLDEESLVKEVIGLANASTEGPRSILFGVNAGALEGGGLVGISDSAMADLKKAHRTISAMIEPVLHLAFIFDRINGKLVGALEIDGCDDKPYIVTKNFSETLKRGQSWTRDGRTLREGQPTEEAQPEKPKPKKKPRKRTKPASIAVGFNDDPSCALLEMDIPDASDPPFAEVTQQVKKPMDLAKTIKEKIGTVTTQILRLGGAQKPSVATGMDVGGVDTQVEEFDGTETVLAEANDHYYYEAKALRFNLSLRQQGSEELENVSIRLGVPKVADFDVVDRLYTSPFDKRAQQTAKTQGYPNVEHRDNAIIVKSIIDKIAPNSPTQAFKCELRLAVGPKMQRKKLAILYTLRDEDKQKIGEGRLKIKFGTVTT